MAPPSGADTLNVRHSYLRKRRSRHTGTWRRTTIWIILGAVAGCICVAGMGGLIIGS